MNDERFSGSDKGNGFGSDSGSGSGSGANGSGGSIGGNGGNVGGNGGNVSGSTGGSIDGTTESSGFTSADNVTNERDTSGNQNDARTETIGSGIGFGSAVADRFADSESDGGHSAGTSARTFGDNAVSVGLGKKQRGRPKGSTNKDSTRTVSLKETRDLVSVFIGSIFDIPAIVLKADFWRLSADENQVLTDAVIAYVDSLPKSQSNKFAKWVSENMPLLNFAMIALFIVGDRVKKTFEVMKAERAIASFSNTTTTAQPVDNRNIVTPLDAQMNGGNFH